MLTEERKVNRSSNVANKYELIIVAAREARRLNELSRQTGLNLGGKVTNVALEEALKGNVLYTYDTGGDEPAPQRPAADAAPEDDEEE
jgi:DNA-directed RNA polymerase omega subunit